MELERRRFKYIQLKINATRVPTIDRGCASINKQDARCTISSRSEIRIFVCYEIINWELRCINGRESSTERDRERERERENEQESHGEVLVHLLLRGEYSEAPSWINNGARALLFRGKQEAARNKLIYARAFHTWMTRFVTTSLFDRNGSSSTRLNSRAAEGIKS